MQVPCWDVFWQPLVQRHDDPERQLALTCQGHQQQMLVLLSAGRQGAHEECDLQQQYVNYTPAWQ